METNQTNKGAAAMTAVSAVTQIEELSKRLERAREIVGERKVSPVVGKEYHYIVEGKDGYYLVNGECTCRDAQYRSEVHKGWCKHMLAVELYKESQPRRSPASPRTPGHWKIS